MVPLDFSSQNVYHIFSTVIRFENSTPSKWGAKVKTSLKNILSQIWEFLGGLIYQCLLLNDSNKMSVIHLNFNHNKTKTLNFIKRQLNGYKS